MPITVKLFFNHHMLNPRTIAINVMITLALLLIVPDVFVLGGISGLFWFLLGIFMYYMTGTEIIRKWYKWCKYVLSFVGFNPTRWNNCLNYATNNFTNTFPNIYLPKCKLDNDGKLNVREDVKREIEMMGYRLLTDYVSEIDFHLNNDNTSQQFFTVHLSRKNWDFHCYRCEKKSELQWSHKKGKLNPQILNCKGGNDIIHQACSDYYPIFVGLYTVVPYQKQNLY